jgi:anthranilate phosphoribosyltransferase
MTAYHDTIRSLIGGQNLSTEQAEHLMSAIIEGLLDQPQVAATLTALAMKSPTADELTGFARIMRRHMLAIDTPTPAFDPCGTGGSGLETANTSTLAAFILAGAGVAVAKHGNRASSGRCGSMDVLEALGVYIELAPDQARELARISPIVFVFARRHHPALGQVTPVRRVLGFPTIFNFLGPACNPAGVRHQLMGVSNPRIAGILAHAMQQLGSERVATVCGMDGLDEISLEAPTRMWHLRDGVVEEMIVRPSDFGVTEKPFSDWAGGDVAHNAAIFRRVLSGNDNSAHTTHSAINAGAALWVAGRADSLAHGYELARENLASGAAWAAFEAYREASARFA